jgi:hypothetical protein
MRTKTSLPLMGILIVTALLGGSSMLAQEPKMPVLNPLGQPPAIVGTPMAPRFATLDGKTIYIVDIGFTDTHQLLTEMQKLLSERYPKTTWIVRDKAGIYASDDPQLWAEIKAKGAGMIIGIGH